MNIRFFRLPIVAKWLYPKAIVTTGMPGDTICLTFDDGPHPATTPIILDILERHNIRAVFFCSGKNAKEYPELLSDIKNAGHIIGNHGYEHLNGLKTNYRKYLKNVNLAEQYTSQTVLRPPYGKLSVRQYKELVKTHKIVLWDLMPYDFDPSLSPENVINIINQKTRKGSIIVLHDRPGCCATVILEEAIINLKTIGFVFVLPAIQG